MTRRTDRVAERIRQELSVGLGQLKNPDVGFVTVTGVKVSSDLGYADVSVSLLSTRKHDDTEKSLKALRHSRGFLQARLGEALGTRVIPELRFHLDTSSERAAEVQELIRDARATDVDRPPLEEYADDETDEE